MYSYLSNMPLTWVQIPSKNSSQNPESRGWEGSPRPGTPRHAWHSHRSPYFRYSWLWNPNRSNAILRRFGYCRQLYGMVQCGHQNLPWYENTLAFLDHEGLRGWYVWLGGRTARHPIRHQAAAAVHSITGVRNKVNEIYTYEKAQTQNSKSFILTFGGSASAGEAVGQNNYLPSRPGSGILQFTSFTIH